MSRSRSGRQAARLGRIFGGRRSWRAVRRMLTVEKLTRAFKELFKPQAPRSELFFNDKPTLVFKVSAR